MSHRWIIEDAVRVPRVVRGFDVSEVMPVAWCCVLCGLRKVRRDPPGGIPRISYRGEDGEPRYGAGPCAVTSRKADLA